MKNIKLKYCITILLVFACIFIIQDVYTFSSYGYPDHAGAPIASSSWGSSAVQATCSTSGCHAGNPLNDPSGLAEFTTDIPEEGWQPGITYTIKAKLTKEDRMAFGFMTMAWGKTDSLSTGTLGTTHSSKAQIANSWTGSSNTYATHKSSSISGNGTNEWSFQWTSPIDGVNDTVVFYSAFVAANSNGKPTGDFVFTKNITLGKSTIPTSIQNEITNSKNITISPTVIEETAIVKAQVNTYNNVTLIIRDINSKIVSQYKCASQELENGYSIHLGTLNKGLYTITLESDKGLQSEKFTKL